MPPPQTSPLQWRVLSLRLYVLRPDGLRQRRPVLQQQPLLRKAADLLRQHVLSLRPEVHPWKLLSLRPSLQWDLLPLRPEVHRWKVLSLSPVLQWVLGDLWALLSLRPDVLQWAPVLSLRPVL